MDNKEATKLVSDLTNYVNNFSNRSAEFNQAMSHEHRTLQQSFTRLCLQWLEYVASDDYQTDPRNEASKEMGKLILSLVRKHFREQGFTEYSLDRMAKPSEHLPLV